MSHPYNYLDSAFVSDKYKLFCDLGYPQLDLVVHKDGSWSILEMLNAPLISGLTRWNYILKNIRNQEISEAFISRMLERINPMKREFWEIERQKEAALDLEEIRKANHREDSVNRAMKIVKKNEGLVERIARNGIGEMDLNSIYKHIPRQQKIGL